jgi:hypothetical protein
MIRGDWLFVVLVVVAVAGWLGTYRLIGGYFTPDFGSSPYRSVPRAGLGTGDTWFFSRVSDASSESRHSLVMAIGSARAGPIKRFAV